jgi:hypothetical protein
MNDATILEARQLAFIDQPRNPSSKPWHMPDEHFCEAVKAELAGVPYRSIAAALAEAGLPSAKVPGRTQWSEFWQSFKPWLRLARRRSAAAGANEVAGEAAKSPAEFDTATLDLIRQMAFELADSDAPDPKGVKALVSLLLKHRDQVLNERKVAVSERKMDLLEKQSSDAQKTLQDETLTPAQRDAKMREIFGIR